MTNYKEIVTKAIINKAKKSSTDNITINIDDKADTILGCWIINHTFNGTSNNNEININGSYDINIWYAYDNNTKTNVVKYSYNYFDILNINNIDNTTNKEVIVRCLNQPSVNEAKIEDNKFKLTANKELAVEVLGDTKIKVPIEVIDDDYEEITSTDINSQEINENYLDK